MRDLRGVSRGRVRNGVLTTFKVSYEEIGFNIFGLFTPLQIGRFKVVGDTYGEHEDTSLHVQPGLILGLRTRVRGFGRTLVGELHKVFGGLVHFFTYNRGLGVGLNIGVIRQQQRVICFTRRIGVDFFTPRCVHHGKTQVKGTRFTYTTRVICRTQGDTTNGQDVLSPSYSVRVARVTIVWGQTTFVKDGTGGHITMFILVGRTICSFTSFANGYFMVHGQTFVHVGLPPLATKVQTHSHSTFGVLVGEQDCGPRLASPPVFLLGSLFFGLSAVLL